MGSEISYNVDDIQKDYMPDRYGNPTRRLLTGIEPIEVSDYQTKATTRSQTHSSPHHTYCDYETTF